MTEEQIKQADTILRFMLNQSGTIQSHQIEYLLLNDLNEPLKTQESMKVDFIIDILSHKQIVSWLPDKYNLKLGANGLKAANIGMKEYLRQEEECRKQNKYVSITDSIVNTGINTGQIINQSSDFDLRDKTNRNTAQTDKAPAAKESTTTSFWLSTMSNIIATIIGGIILYFIVDYLIKWIKT